MTSTLNNFGPRVLSTYIFSHRVFENTQIGSFNKTNRFVYYRPRFVTALCLVLEHKSAKLDLLAVTDTLKNCDFLVLTDLCIFRDTAVGFGSKPSNFSELER